MIIDFSGDTVQAITDTTLLGGGSNDLGGNVVNNEQVPIMRHGNAKNGSCLVEVNDGGTYTKSLAELLALHSGPGEGDQTVTIDGVIYAYNALLTISMIGICGQYISINWKGAHA